MKTLDIKESQQHIVQWMKTHLASTGLNGWVIGVSGGVDSALVSTLCAETGHPLLCVEMPIYQNKEHVSRAANHINWLKANYDNVESIELELTSVFDSMVKEFESATNQLPEAPHESTELALANTRSRLRMTGLYYYSNLLRRLVAGTGNKVEDFGIGFCTKGGDQMVDLSPIGDLVKSEVFAMAENLGISSQILTAAPSDGLWDDSRTDSQQIGAEYNELEWAMDFIETNPRGWTYSPEQYNALTDRQKEVLEIYKTRHFANRHKMEPIPVCSVEKFRK